MCIHGCNIYAMYVMYCYNGYNNDVNCCIHVNNLSFYILNHCMKYSLFCLMDEHWFLVRYIHMMYSLYLNFL